MKAQLKLLGPIISIFVVILTGAFLVYMADAAPTFAFVVEGGDCGFAVQADNRLVDVSNLNPGDTKSSYLIVSNKKDTPLYYYLNLIKVDGEPRQGEPGIPPKEPETTEDIIEEPQDPKLPQTGELPPYLFYGAGALLVLAGILLAKWKRLR